MAETRELSSLGAEQPSIIESMLRVVRRPRPLILYYLFTLIPSAVMALVLLGAVAPLTRYPTLLKTIERRSFDEAMYFLLGAGGTNPDPMIGVALLVFLIGLAVVLIVWPLLGIFWVWLEGGTLETYHLPGPLSWKDFRRICGHWFGPFLTLNLLGVVVIAVVILIGGGLAWAAGLVAPWLTWVIGIPVALLVGALATWVELARAAMVARVDRDITNALKSAWTLFWARPQPILAITVGTLIVSLLLLGAGQLLNNIPYDWWFLILLLQQGLFIARLGMRLAREAGQIAVMAEVLKG